MTKVYISASGFLSSNFYFVIKHYFPELQNLEFQEKRRDIPWSDDQVIFRAFVEGRTGYPIVDAAIRQVHVEGYMHNRARLIVASFLTKDLFIDWRLGGLLQGASYRLPRGGKFRQLAVGSIC